MKDDAQDPELPAGGFRSRGEADRRESVEWAQGADLVPGGALRWRPCECGHPVLCPDYVPPQKADGRGEL